MTTLFLFGAGASHGNPDCKPSPPPLGGTLFAALETICGVAASLPATFAESFRADFEIGMLRLLQEGNEFVSPFLYEMGEFFAGFSAGQDNYYAQLIDIVVRSRRNKAIYASLNYDTLLEQSILSRDYRMTYGARRADAPDIHAVLKIHGSCNFLPDVGSNTFSNGYADTRRGNPMFYGPMRFEMSMVRVAEHCRRRTSFPPAMSLYARGKAVLTCSRQVAEQQAIFTNEAQRATRIVVIGVAVNPNDTHIWDPIAKASGDLIYVGRHADIFENWCRAVRRRKATVAAETFESSLAVVRRILAR